MASCVPEDLEGKATSAFCPITTRDLERHRSVRPQATRLLLRVLTLMSHSASSLPGQILSSPAVMAGSSSPVVCRSGLRRRSGGRAAANLLGRPSERLASHEVTSRPSRSPRPGPRSPARRSTVRSSRRSPGFPNVLRARSRFGQPHSWAVARTPTPSEDVEGGPNERASPALEPSVPSSP